MSALFACIYVVLNLLWSILMAFRHCLECYLSHKEFLVLLIKNHILFHGRIQNGSLLKLHYRTTNPEHPMEHMTTRPVSDSLINFFIRKTIIFITLPYIPHNRLFGSVWCIMFYFVIWLWHLKMKTMCGMKWTCMNVNAFENTIKVLRVNTNDGRDVGNKFIFFAITFYQLVLVVWGL